MTHDRPLAFHRDRRVPVEEHGLADTARPVQDLERLAPVATGPDCGLDELQEVLAAGQQRRLRCESWPIRARCRHHRSSR